MCWILSVKTIPDGMSNTERAIDVSRYTVCVQKVSPKRREASTE